MTKDEFQAWLDRWSLKPSDGAKVLLFHPPKISEFLSGACQIPDYIAAHIETFDELADMKATRLIKKRLAKANN